MKEMLSNSVFFGVILSIGAYILGDVLKRKFKSPLFNPLLISTAVTISVLALCGMDYESYCTGGKYLGYFLTPATVCLAIPLYEQFEKLKKNAPAILIGIISGMLTSFCSILAMSLIMKFSHEEYVTFLPKSITTAIGVGVSEEIGGYVGVTAAVIVITGILGNLIADGVFKLFRIKEPVARGVALGTSSHILGTVKAIELGEIEGAISSLSVVTAGILTVIFAPMFANFI
ncbi:MAG: LrgB family protein [Oscillospiraceae bacterium]